MIGVTSCNIGITAAAVSFPWRQGEGFSGRKLVYSWHKNQKNESNLEGKCSGFGAAVLNELALGGMIHLIALSLPVDCLRSDTAPVSWVRKKRLCQATGWCEPKPGQGMTWCFQGKTIQLASVRSFEQNNKITMGPSSEALTIPVIHQ